MASDEIELNRRDFLAASAAISTIVTLPAFARVPVPPAKPPEQVRAPSKVHLKMTVNGKATELDIDSRSTLLDVLREDLDLTGSKKGCDHGQCGACTVIVDGKRINSCLSLAAQNQGKKVMTIEGLANGDQLHPMQAAFIEHDAFQCGFCTPGQIMSAVALLKEPCGKSEGEIRECMSGNICRCGAYRNIVSAIQEVQKKGG